MNKVLSIASAAGLFLSPTAFAATIPVTAEGRDYFEAHIRPVLVAECYECHAGDKSKGGLLLDSRDALRKGGDNGPGLIPGDATGSLLIQSLAHTHADVDLHMPKNGAKLDDTTLKHFIAWVNMGAPDPRDQPSKVEGAQSVSWDQVFALRRQWWSLQPLQRPAVPATGESRNPVDAFILAKLSDQGLQMSPEADRRLLIRRLSYALTGLPPKPEEIKRFLADASPQAWATLIDYYLALPSYGETWARHWMDLMRYAESHGSEGDPTIPEAWRYRDYLTRAFNADLPYDQFVREHVAGDLLKPRWNDDLGINESLLATANLRLVEHGFQPVDSLDEQVKMVDNQVDVFSKSFLGLTVSCARCHDHKFDAISQKDFFGLYGIFASTRPAQVVLDKPERLDIHRDELQKLKGEIKSELARLWLTAAERLPDQLLKGGPSGGGSAWRANVEGELDELRSQARAQALALKGGSSVEKSVPQPTACWNFEGDVQDSVGQLHGELMGGAAVRNGKLLLNGEDAFVQTAPLTKSISARTLEAWVKLASTDQRGGGVVSIETERGEIFDSIVFGEKRPMEWLSGSNNHRRTRDSGGPPEQAAQNQFAHVAIVYAPDNSVTIYRNGEMYGQPYVPEEELQTYLAGSGHILLGKRHLGGGSALLKGEIEEARLYDRALVASEVAASFKAGAIAVTEKDLVAAMTEGQRRKFEELNTALKSADAAAKADPTAENWAKTLGTTSKDGTDALVPWSRLRNRTGTAFAKGWSDLVTGWTQDLESRRSYNTANFTVLWDLASGEDYKKWFKEGNGLPLQPAAPGEFVVEPEGNVVVQHLLPAGVYSPLISSKHAALLTSPYFKMDTDAMSFQFTGDDGGGVRVIVDNYPLGNNNTYPQFRPGGEPLRWFKLDTTYRKGSRAYVEFATRDDSTRPQPPSLKAVKKGAKPEEYMGRSWFGVSKMVLHKGNADTPKEEVLPTSALFSQSAPKDAAELAKLMSRTLADAILAWQKGSMTAEQQVYLDAYVSRGLLPVQDTASTRLLSLMTSYRKLEAEIPIPTRAPGPVEGNGYETALMVRGDHLKPAGEVPRAFLSALGGANCQDAGSGRLELADAMTARSNPLLARVMVNRIWHWLFGKGLVGTVDNFGRLGDKPSHPELLDYLAIRFEEEGWSVKQMIRLMLTSNTWRQSSDAAPATVKADAANQWFSRARVQRLEAEMIRDAMLRVSGGLKEDMYGEPVGDAQRRRSLYLRERRTSPQAFMEVFDRPKPTTTRGQRDATNIPAQSLTMMNDRFVIDLALIWARRMARPESGSSLDARIASVYESSLSRPPSAEEFQIAREYLGEGETEDAWRDYLQAVFGLKEFIYLR